MSDLWSPANPWGHDPEVCGTMNCPGCYAAAYVPPAKEAVSETLDALRGMAPDEDWSEDDARETADLIYGEEG